MVPTYCRLKFGKQALRIYYIWITTTNATPSFPVIAKEVCVNAFLGFASNFCRQVFLKRVFKSLVEFELNYH